VWSAGAHQLHFDTDERTFTAGSGTPLTHPRVSSILYLSGAGAGPTLITDKEPGTAGLGTAGLLAWPDQNRYVTFPGTLLHGVMPKVWAGGGAGVGAGAADGGGGAGAVLEPVQPPQHRLTLIAAYGARFPTESCTR
jgi:hypothetical protein